MNGWDEEPEMTQEELDEWRRWDESLPYEDEVPPDFYPTPVAGVPPDFTPTPLSLEKE